MTTYQGGQTASLQFNLFNEDTGGSLADPSALQLDITPGTIATAPGDSTHDVSGGGQFTYQGASLATAGQIWRVAQGIYQFDWVVPYDIDSGVYVANWAATYAGDLIPAVEDFVVAGVYGAGSTAPPPVDVGFWDGSLVGPDGTTVQFGAVDSDPGTAGVAWMWEGISGVDGPDTSGQVVQRAGDHGGYATSQYYGPRIMTLSCHATAPTMALRDAARAKLQRALTVGGAAGLLSTLTLPEAVRKTMLVRRSGKLIETYPNTGTVVFTVGLVAPDPRRYATVMQSSRVVAPVTVHGITPPLTPPIAMPANGVPATLALVNGGNFETRPRILIDGPVTSPSLTLVDTGQVVSFTGTTVNLGSQLIVDFAQKQALLDSRLVPADISSSWWVLNPGASTVRLGGVVSSGGAMTAQWQDAYI